MSGYIDKEEIRNARKADLYGFLLSNHHDLVKRVGQYITLYDHDSLMIKEGYPGYVRNSTGETGNTIDFLTRYLGYSFENAVSALNGNSSSKNLSLPSDVFRGIPKSAEKPYKRVFAYLVRTRGLSPEVVNRLMDAGLLYQDLKGNAVFVNYEKTYCELRGTLSDIPFHQAMKTEGKKPFWYFKAGNGFSAAFICESAIDAISLFELQRSGGQFQPGSIYCSIGGVGKQNAIDWIYELAHGHVVLAVDNDAAGDKCRIRNDGLEHLIPKGKDWNEDLARRKAGLAKE